MPPAVVPLDKIIAFDVVRGDADGKLTLANIQGIFLNVGLWVRVKEFAMAVNEQNSPIAELTAGAFGVDKKVKVELPQGLFKRLRQGIDKFDPFLVIASQSGANSGTASASTATAASATTTATAADAPSAATASNSAATKAPAQSTIYGLTGSNSSLAGPSSSKVPSATSNDAQTSAATSNSAAVSDNNAPAAPASGASETSVVK